MTKTIVLGQGRGVRPSILDNPGGRIFAAGDEAVPTATKRIGGKTFFFGAWRGQTEGEHYERWQRASAVADDIVTLRDNLQKSGFFTDEGVKQEMHSGAGMFLREKTKLFRQIDKEIGNVEAKGQALYELDDWNLDSPYHDRLIKRWNALPEEEQRVRIRKGLEPDLIKALICEPEFTSGIDDETRVELRESLLTDDEKELNAQYSAELAQLQAIGKAWGTATDVILEQAQTTENALIEYLVVDDDDDNPEPPEEGVDSLATGGVFKLDLGGNDAESNTD